jgi:hypothetical protein
LGRDGIALGMRAPDVLGQMANGRRNAPLPQSFALNR